VSAKGSKMSNQRDAHTGRSILIIEDDPKTIKLLGDILQVSGFVIMEATTGRQGVESARRNNPDLILMDIQLPVMDGLQSTRVLKQDPATRGIPVIALTAYAMPGDRERMIQAGCDEYIKKPFDIREVQRKVTEHILEQQK